MKTNLTIQKSILSKLIRTLMFVALFCLSVKANAQCAAAYTFTVDPANNGNVTFTNTSSAGTGLYYNWNFGDGTTDNSATPPIHTYGSTGTFNVCLTIHDSIGMYDSLLGCYNTYCATISVINSATPCTAHFSFTTDTTTNVYFNNTSSALGASVNFTWNFGDGTTSNLENPYNHTYPAAGTYYVCLTMDDSSISCHATFCDSITIGSSPILPCSASFTPYDSLGYGYFINNSTGTGITSTWNFGDGTSGTSTGDTIHHYASSGSYSVCLTITSSTGCTASYCDSIVIGGSTGSCSAYFNAVDSSTFIQFFDASSGAGPLNYHWDFGDGTTSNNVGNKTHIYSSPGTYSVCLTVSDTAGTCSNTYCNSVIVSSTPPCYSYFAIVQDSSNLYNYFLYNYSSTASGTTYLWDFGDGTTSTLEYPSHTYAASSPVLICLTISNSFLGCTATHCDSINPGHASGTFTINVVHPLGIAEQTNIISSLENYPNPFSDNTTINYSIKQDATIELCIVDLLGNRIAEIEKGNKTSGIYSTTWNSDGVAQGMYLLQLKVGNTVSTKKLIINK